MNPVRLMVLGVLVAGLFVSAASAYRVGEAEQVIITQFGDPIGAPIATPGLHF
jgi:membrane protease subunit HflC